MGNLQQEDHPAGSRQSVRPRRHARARSLHQPEAVEIPQKVPITRPPIPRARWEYGRYSYSGRSVGKVTFDIAIIKIVCVTHGLDLCPILYLQDGLETGFHFRSCRSSLVVRLCSLPIHRVRRSLRYRWLWFRHELFLWGLLAEEVRPGGAPMVELGDAGMKGRSLRIRGEWIECSCLLSTG